MTQRMTVEPTTVRQWQLENREFVLLDCREQDEFDFVRLPGCVLFPMSEIGGRLSELKEFQTRTKFARRPMAQRQWFCRSLQLGRWNRSLVVRSRSATAAILKTRGT
jgi:rhodanese-related sulfurtransferase